MARHKIMSAAEYAQEMARISMRLQRTSDKGKQARLLEAADRCLNGYKLARVKEREHPNENISEEVGQGLEVPLQALGDVINDTLKPMAWILLAFSEEADGPRTNYVANCNRDDAAKAMAEFIAVHEAGK